MSGIQRVRCLARRLAEQCRQGRVVSRRSWRRTCWGAIDLLFPPACLLCERLMEDASEVEADERPLLVCEECRSSFGYRADGVCVRCAAPLPRGCDAASCPECRRRELPFAGACALGEYRGRLREAVLKSKRAAHESLTLQLGELVARRLVEAGWRQGVDLVIPLPSHWWRRWMRGTSGPELVAGVLARRLDRPLEGRVLQCHRRTRKQGMLLPAERIENVRGAFVARRADRIRGRQVLLVDDVMTTGATLKEAARVLLKAGASAVQVVVLARGTGDAAR